MITKKLAMKYIDRQYLKKYQFIEKKDLKLFRETYEYQSAVLGLMVDHNIKKPIKKALLNLMNAIMALGRTR